MKPVKSCFHPMLHKIIVTLSKCWFGVTVFYGRLNRKPPEIPVIRRVEIIISKPVGRPFCPCMLMFPVFFSRSVSAVQACFGNMAPEKPKPPFPELQNMPEFMTKQIKVIFHAFSYKYSNERNGKCRSAPEVAEVEPE